MPGRLVNSTVAAATAETAPRGGPVTGALPSPQVAIQDPSETVTEDRLDLLDATDSNLDLA